MIVSEKQQLDNYKKSKNIKEPFKFVYLLCKEQYENNAPMDIAIKEVNILSKKYLKSKYKELEYYNNIVTFCKTIYKKNIKFVEVESIKIRQSELDVIKNAKNNNEGRVLFSLLFFTKLELAKGNKGWVSKLDDVFKYAKIKSRTQNEKMSYMKEYVENGLVKFYLDFKKCANNPNQKVSGIATFYDDISDVAFEIPYLDNFDLYYDLYVSNAKNLKQCEVCGKIIKKSKNGRVMYCEDCAKEQDKEKAKLRKNS